MRIPPAEIAFSRWIQARRRQPFWQPNPPLQRQPQENNQQSRKYIAYSHAPKPLYPIITASPEAPQYPSPTVGRLPGGLAGSVGAVRPVRRVRPYPKSKIENPKPLFLLL